VRGRLGTISPIEPPPPHLPAKHVAAHLLAKQAASPSPGRSAGRRSHRLASSNPRIGQAVRGHLLEEDGREEEEEDGREEEEEDGRWTAATQAGRQRR
jgi:hypothetical protein